MPLQLGTNISSQARNLSVVKFTLTGQIPVPPQNTNLPYSLDLMLSKALLDPFPDLNIYLECS